jgi:hypothetical protein
VTHGNWKLLMCEHEDFAFASCFFMLLTDDSLLVLKKMMGIQDLGNTTIYRYLAKMVNTLLIDIYCDLIYLFFMYQDL